MSIQPKILVSIAIILGLFIAISFVREAWGTNQDQRLNIGCYLQTNSLNHTQQLYIRVGQIRHNLSLMNSLSYEYRSLVDNQTNFHNKSLQLAHSFQRYVQKLTENHHQQRQNMQILMAIKQAELQFDTCRKKIEQVYSEEQCRNNWQEYEQCFSRIDVVRGQLARLTSVEQQIKLLIDRYIHLPNNTEPAIRIAERVYNQSIKDNDKIRQQLSLKLDNYLKELKLKSFQKDQSVSKLVEIDKPYKECQQNRKEYRNCEEITKSINTLDYGSIDILKERIEYKKNMLGRLILVLGKPEDRKSMDVLNQQYKKHAEEYKRMLKTLIEATQQIKKACGCTEQYAQSLAKQIKKTEEEVLFIHKEITRLNNLIQKTQADLNQYQKNRQHIISQYKKALNESDISGPEHIESELIKLKRKLESNNRETLKLQEEYNTIQNDCRQTKERMTFRIKDVDQVGDCLRKKQYFLKLRDKMSSYLHPDNQPSKILENKKILAASLQSFDQL